MSTKVYDIKQISQILQISEMYVRRLILEGKLQSQKIPVKAGSEVMKNVVTEEALKAYSAQPKNHSVRSDKRTKYTLYADDSEIEQIYKLIESAHLGIVIKKTNEGEYERRKEAKLRKNS